MAIERPHDLSRVGSDVPDVKSPISDEIAKREKELFGGERRRSEEKKESIHKLFLFVIRVVVVCVMVILVIRMIHFILPKEVCWLSVDQIKGIDDFFAHGAIGGILVGSVKQILSAHIPSNGNDEPESGER